MPASTDERALRAGRCLPHSIATLTVFDTPVASSDLVAQDRGCGFPCALSEAAKIGSTGAL